MRLLLRACSRALSRSWPEGGSAAGARAAWIASVAIRIAAEAIQTGTWYALDTRRFMATPPYSAQESWTGKAALIVARLAPQRPVLMARRLPTPVAQPQTPEAR